MQTNIMNNITFYRLPECSTCQKAQRFLDRHGVKISEFRDIKTEPLSRLEVEKIARNARFNGGRIHFFETPDSGRGR